MIKSRFTDDERRLFLDKTREFLESRSWIRKEYDGRILYLKQGVAYPPISFLGKPRKRNLPSPQDVINEFGPFFLVEAIIEELRITLQSLEKSMILFYLGQEFNLLGDVFGEMILLKLENFFSRSL